MISSVVDRIDSDGIDAQLLEFLEISLASLCVSDRVNNVGRSTRLVVNTTDVEALISSKESYRKTSVGVNGFSIRWGRHHFP
jgi:hypothetical protein